MFLIILVFRGGLYMMNVTVLGRAPGLRNEGTSFQLSAGQRLRPYTSPENIPQPVSQSFLPPGIYPDPLFLDHELSLCRLKASVRICWFSEFDWSQIPINEQKALSCEPAPMKARKSRPQPHVCHWFKKKETQQPRSETVQLTESNWDSG